MSAFRTTFALRAPMLRSAASRSMGATRSFQSYRPLAVDDEGRSEEVAKKRDEHLQAQKEGKNTWTEDLASDSESMVKADRGDTKDAQQTIKELQKETAKVAQKGKEGEIKKAP